MKTILIPADENLPVCQIETSGLESLQAAVGGYIESLPVPGEPNATAYINEEGKLQGLPANYRASLIWAQNEMLYPGDFICGDLIITGFNNETGEQQPLPESLCSDLPRAQRNPANDGWIVELDIPIG